MEDTKAFCRELNSLLRRSSGSGVLSNSSLTDVLSKAKEGKSIEELCSYAHERYNSLLEQGSSAVKMWAGGGCSVGGNSMGSVYGDYYRSQMNGYSEAIKLLSKYSQEDSEKDD